LGQQQLDPLPGSSLPPPVVPFGVLLPPPATAWPASAVEFRQLRQARLAFSA
jgi:hypothetical protein